MLAFTFGFVLAFFMIIKIMASFQRMELCRTRFYAQTLCKHTPTFTLIGFVFRKYLLGRSS